MAARFQRHQRLLNRTEFLALMREGSRIVQDCFNVQFRANGMSHSRLGVTVGRRVAAEANRRNTIKRVVRECFRHRAVSLPACDIVFSARRGAAERSRRELREAATKALDQIAARAPASTRLRTKA